MYLFQCCLDNYGSQKVSEQEERPSSHDIYCFLKDMLTEVIRFYSAVRINLFQQIRNVSDFKRDLGSQCHSDAKEVPDGIHFGRWRTAVEAIFWNYCCSSQYLQPI